MGGPSIYMTCFLWEKMFDMLSFFISGDLRDFAQNPFKIYPKINFIKSKCSMSFESVKQVAFVFSVTVFFENGKITHSYHSSSKHVPSN